MAIETTEFTTNGVSSGSSGFKGLCSLKIVHKGGATGNIQVESKYPGEANYSISRDFSNHNVEVNMMTGASTIEYRFRCVGFTGPGSIYCCLVQA